MTKEVQHELGSARLPRNYRAVYAVLCDLGLGEHAGAGEIYVAARKRQPTIGYSTVYRALERLTTLGLITEVRVPGAQSILYEPVRAAHAHFFCQSCRSVQDVAFDLPSTAVGDLARRYGVSIDKTELTFEGLCRACAQRALTLPADHAL